MSDIRTQIIARRMSLGMSKAELGRRSGIARANICRFERLDHSPTEATLRKLCAALGLSLDVQVSASGEGGPLQQAKCKVVMSGCQRMPHFHLEACAAGSNVRLGMIYHGREFSLVLTTEEREALAALLKV